MSSLPTELDFAANPAATPARMNEAMAYIVSKLKALESLAPGIEDAINTLNTVGLERLTAVLQPLADQANGIVDGLATVLATWQSDQTFDEAVAQTTAAVEAALADYRNNYLGAHATAPTTKPDGTPVDIGCMYFDTTVDAMKVLGASGWKNAGSSVAGLLNQFAPIAATAGQTLFTIPGGYDSGYLILTRNGVVIPTTDYTATDGETVNLVTGLSAGDELGGIAFGAVTLSSVYSKAEADAAFAAIGAAYTKAEADAKFALATDVYTKSASDAHFANLSLSNLTDAAAARANLGVGTAGTRADGYFLRVSNALSDIVPTIARANLGLRTAALINMAVGTAAPASPVAGDLWVDTN